MRRDYFKIILLTACLFIISYNGFSQRQAKRQKSAKTLATGEVFNCQVEAIESGLPNYFRVRASKNTDAAVRLVDKKTDKCVRYAFINASDSYDMKGIPEGKYYVKIALGQDWYFEDSTKCIGQFRQFAIYEKLGRTLDFNVKGSKNNQKVPSHELDLDVTKGKSESSELIDVKEFQK